MKKTPEWYRKIFEVEMREGRDILNKHGELLIFVEDEEFKQCWSANDPAREVLPWSWFISNKTGNLISVTGNGQLEWLLKIDDNNGYAKYKYRHPQTGQIKNIMVHNLVGLVWGADRFGRAEEILADKNVYAFGTKDELLNVNGHHIKSNKEYKECTFNHDNIQFVTVELHKILHGAPKEDASDAEKMEFMAKLSDIAEKECPNKICVFAVGDEKCADTVDKVYFSLDSLRQLKSVMDAYNSKG